jgi:hypothetical protein
MRLTDAQHAAIDRAVRRLIIWAACVAALFGLVAYWQQVWSLVFGLLAFVWGLGTSLQEWFNAPHGPFTHFDWLLLFGLLYWMATSLARIARRLDRGQ